MAQVDPSKDYAGALAFPMDATEGQVGDAVDIAVDERGAEVSKIATINSARSLGLEEEFGTLEAGKRADLAILDGDTLPDFRVIGSRVAALFMDGKLVINNCGLEVESSGKAQD